MPRSTRGAQRPVNAPTHVNPLETLKVCTGPIVGGALCGYGLDLIAE